MKPRSPPINQRGPLSPSLVARHVNHKHNNKLIPSNRRTIRMVGGSIVALLAGVYLCLFHAVSTGIQTPDTAATATAAAIPPKEPIQVVGTVHKDGHGKVPDIEEERANNQVAVREMEEEEVEEEDTKKSEQDNADTYDNTIEENGEETGADNNHHFENNWNSEAETINDNIETTTTTTTNENNFEWSYPTPTELEALQKCFPLNSKEWLRGPRLGNSRRQDDLMDDAYLASMLLFGQHSHNNKNEQEDGNRDDKADFSSQDTLLRQTICHDDSRFKNVTDPLTDDRSMELWIVRLTYMAIHRIQHQFAVPEARHRIPTEATTAATAAECQRLAEDHQIGRYDYECPQGKFLIVPVENLGLGAVMRTNVLSGLLAAMATHRTVLFINNAPTGPKPIRQPWFHASCNRSDIQCFFHAPTPCVLTHDQLNHSLVVNEFRNISKLFKNPNGIMEEPFWDQAQTIVLPLKTVTRTTPKTLPDILRNFTLEFHDSLDEKDPRRHVLKEVAARFVSRVHKDKVIQLISYGLVLYAMRPHLQSQQNLKDLMQQIVPPSSKKALPETTLGLPIRASDKCLEESECFPFEKYMRVMVQQWHRYKVALTQAMKDASLDKVSIVLTTESASVLKEKDAFMANTSLVEKMVPFPFEFVINEFDIQQDSGNPKFNIPEHNLDMELQENKADEVMLSMISSLQLQLLTRYTIGNCCSNFHRLLFELLDGGCGAAYQISLECLQKNENPEFRICCVWDNSPECQKRNVKAIIGQKYKAVKKKRMQERVRRMNVQAGTQQSLLVGGGRS